MMNMQTNAQVEVSEMQRESIYPWTPRPVVTAGGYLLSKIDAIVSNFDRQLSDNRNWENSPRTVDVVPPLIIDSRSIGELESRRFRENH